MIFNSDGDLYENGISEYNSNGKTKETWFYKDKLSSTTIFRYDSKGNNVEESKYGSDGELYKKKIYKYDLYNNLIEDSEYLYDKLKYKWVYKNDFRGNKVEESKYDSENNLKPKFLYKFMYEYEYYD